MSTNSAENTSFIDSLASDPSFWVSISFVIFMAFFIKKVLPFITKALDNKSALIRTELDEAQGLREEAQATLASYQKRQREVMDDADRIIVQAQKEAEELKKTAEAKLEEEIQRRVALANEKIARAESQALQKVQSNIVDIAVMAAQELIVERIDAGGDDELISLAINDAERIVH